MRVVGGEWRGRRLTAPPGTATRPTSDRVREAVFDVLAPLLAGPADEWPAGGPFAGLAVLDLFAGSGALGIEALSRGAASCTFVEPAPAALHALRENLVRVGADAGSARVRPDDYRRALKADAAEARLYNLVFVDAPYALYATIEPELAALVRAVLAPQGLIVVETSKGQAVHLPLDQRSSKVYGDTRITFLSES